MKTLFLLSIALFGINSFVFTQQWVQTAGTPQGGGITDMVVTSNGTIVVTCANYNYPSGQLGGIRHSTNGGATWVNDFQHYTARTLALGQNDLVFASSWNYPTTTEGLYVSTNQGITWTTYRYLVGASNNIFSILVRDNNQTVYIGTRTGVMKSTNGGFAFTPVNNGIPANSWVRDIEADSAGTLAAATTNGLFISTNNASSWVQATGITDTMVTLCFDYPLSSDGSGNDTRLLAGSDNGEVKKSFSSAGYLICTFMAIFGDNEASEYFVLKLHDENRMVHGVATFPLYNNNTSGFFTSTDEGETWQQYNSGLPANPKISAAGAQVLGSRDNIASIVYYLGLFENTSGGAKVYRLETLFGIQQISGEVPNAFSLSQNYPNPFNPMTKIKFNVSKASNVNITVFDVLGRHITTLVNEKLTAGSYETEWNANNMPGGVYFYRIETEDFSETKKMILVK